jgi:hypothetical protein
VTSGRHPWAAASDWAHGSILWTRVPPVSSARGFDQKTLQPGLPPEGAQRPPTRPSASGSSAETSPEALGFHQTREVLVPVFARVAVDDALHGRVGFQCGGIDGPSEARRAMSAPWSPRPTSAPLVKGTTKGPLQGASKWPTRPARVACIPVEIYERVYGAARGLHGQIGDMETATAVSQRAQARGGRAEAARTR